MAIAIYPGSFDPITLGHCDIIRRVQAMYGEVTVLISHSPKKSHLFTAEERKELAEKSLKGLPGVRVDIYDGLTVDYVKAVKGRVIVRGLRAVTDFEYEFVMANMNRKLAPNIETVIVFASPEFYYISSSTLKEVAVHGGSVRDMVPPVVDRALKTKFADKIAKRKISQKDYLQTLRKSLEAPQNVKAGSVKKISDKASTKRASTKKS